MEAALKLVEPEDVQQKALGYVEAVKSLPPIKTPEEYLAVGELWKQGKALLEEIKEGYDDLIQAAHKLHKDTIAKRDRYYVPTEEGVKAAKQLMSVYDEEQERIQREEKARLAEIARKAEEERRLQEALAAENAGEKEEAEEILQEPVHIAPVIVPKVVPKIKGGPSFRRVWAAEVRDIKALCRAIAEGKASPNLVTPNMAALNKLATALKETMNVPGVRAYSRRV